MSDKPKELRYGDDKTIHGTEHVNVETRDGKVVSVWFRCMMLPFEQVEVGDKRAADMLSHYSLERIKAIVFHL